MAEQWNKEKVIAHLEEKQYAKHSDWVKDKKTSYYYAQKQEWYLEIRNKYFSNARQVNWNKERVIQYLQDNNFESYGEWPKRSHSCYQYAMQQPWFEEVRSEFFPNFDRKVWNKEKVIEVLKEKNFSSLIEWSKNHHSYSYARKQPWFKEIRAEFFPAARPAYKWTKEKIADLLTEKNYLNVYAWNLDNPSSYKFVSRQGWMKEMKAQFFPKKLRKPKTTKKVLEAELA